SGPAPHEIHHEPRGFEWVDCSDVPQSVVSFTRRGRGPDSTVLVVCNFTPVPRAHYRLGVPAGGFWQETLNSDAQDYGGRGHGNFGGVDAAPIREHGRPYSLTLT